MRASYENDNGTWQTMTSTFGTRKKRKKLELWQSKPCLFDVSAKLYRNRTAEKLTVTEIAAAVGRTHYYSTILK